jgi:hypothetical protein
MPGDGMMMMTMGVVVVVILTLTRVSMSCAPVRNLALCGNVLRGLSVTVPSFLPGEDGVPLDEEPDYEGMHPRWATGTGMMMMMIMLLVDDGMMIMMMMRGRRRMRRVR